MLNRSEQFTSYENDIRFTSDENDMISGNARQIKECKTDLSPEGSPSSGSIDSNIKGKRKFMRFFCKNRIQQCRVWNRRFSGLREGLRPFKKSKPRNTRHVFKKSKLRDTLQKSHPRVTQPLSLGAFCRRSG